jgi:hypothetical protein
MFQAMLVNIRKTAAISMPTALPLNNAIKSEIAAGKNPSIGIDCNTSTMGITILDAKEILAAVIPTTIAAIKDNPKAINILETEEIESIIKTTILLDHSWLDSFWVVVLVLLTLLAVVL